LIQRVILLRLEIASTLSSAFSAGADDFIDEQNARRFFLGHRKNTTHSRRADADEQFLKLLIDLQLRIILVSAR
jgi:hypothetical protein